MIYTVTFNPAVDYVMHVNRQFDGGLARSQGEEYFAGGKGINVSIVLSRLGVDSTALGFVAGFTGDYIEKSVAELGIRSDFVRLKEGNTRINVKVKATSESEINGAGPTIDDAAYKEFLGRIEKLTSEDTVVFSGSLGNGMTMEQFDDILTVTEQSGAKMVCDCSGEALKTALKHNLFLVKPNQHELGELLGKKLESAEDVVAAADSIKNENIKNILVSMGGEGAVLCGESVWFAEAPKGKVVNTVGSGDSMVAGFLFAENRFGNAETALKYGIAAGSATAFDLGLAQKTDIEKIFAQID